VIYGIGAMAIAGRLWANGVSFGLDYGIYQPDGAHYTYRTLLFLGHNSTEAANQVVSWYQIHGFKNNIFDASLLTPDNKSTWGLVAPRVVYSILSIPFVFALGIPGMLVIPALSFLGLLISIFFVGRCTNHTYLALATVFGLSVSPTVLRWMLANLTDSPLTAFFGLAPVLLMKSDGSKRVTAYITVLVLLTSLTRFCLPIWIAIGIVMFLNSRKRDSLILLITSLVASIPTFLYMPSNAVLPGSQQPGTANKILGVILSFFKITFWEITELAVLDRVLLAMLLIATATAVLTWREINSQYFLAILLAVFFIGAINGTIGVNFRYQLPIVSFMAWVLISNSLKVRDRFFRG